MSTSTKSIEVTQAQIKAYENGATMFIFPIDTEIPSGYIPQGMSRKENKPYQYNMWNGDLKDVIFLDMPIQKGDKDIILYETKELDFENYDHESSFKLYKISECIDVKVVRVGELLISDIDKLRMEDDFVNGNFPYQNKDYIFLIEIKDEKDEL